MLGAILVILSLIAGATYVAKIGTGFTLLFIGAVVFMAYKRLPLIAFTVVFTLLLAGYTYIAPPAGIWKGFLWVLLAAIWLFNLRPLRKAIISRPFLKAYMRLLPSMSQTEKEALEAGTVWWDGELFTGKPKFEKLLASKAPVLTAEEQAFIDGPCEELCRMYDDWEVTHKLGDMPPTVVGLPQAQGFLRDDHPEEIRRPRVLRVRALLRAGQTRQPLGIAGRHHRGAELARPRRAAESLRHRRTEEPLPAAPGAWRGSALLRAHASARRLRRRVDAGHRHRLQGHVPGQGDRRAQAQLFQALHHARTDRDGSRPGVPALRSGQVVRRRQGRLRHHLRADSARHAGPQHRPASLPAQRAVPERSAVGQGRVRTARHHHWRAEDGRPGLAHAGRAALGGPLHLAAVERHRRRQGGRVRLGRVHAHPPAVQHVGGQVRGRGSRHRAHGRLHLHHGRGALRDRGRHRRR